VEIIKNIIRLQVFRFLLVGLFCASIEYLTFNGLINAFKVEYLIANVISIVIAVSINYILSKAFVFEKSRYSKRDEFLSFVLFSVLAIVLNQFILWVFFEIVKLDIRLCKAFAIIIVAAFNFLTKKHIVFKA